MSEGEAILLFAALLGAISGCVFALLPGSHPYLLVGGIAYLWSNTPQVLSPLLAAGFLLGATTSWLLISPLTLVLLRAPDDVCASPIEHSAQAAFWLSAGGLAGIVGVVVLAPGLREGVRLLQQSLQPLFAVALLGLTTLVILLDPLLEAALASSLRQRLRAAMTSIGISVLTFCLSGALGLVLTQRSPLPSHVAVFGLPLALIGLFAVPGLLGSLSRVRELLSTIAAQPLHSDRLLRGGVLGLLAGVLVSLLPLSAGGVCGVLARHAVLTRDEQTRWIAVGAARTGFYLVSVLTLVAPGAALPESSPLSALTGVVPAQGWRGYWLAVAAIAASGTLAFSLLLVLMRFLSPRSLRWDARRLSIVAVLILLGLALSIGGAQGALIFVAAAAIGAIPSLLGGAPSGALGVVLVPAVLSALGLSEVMGGWLGLP